MSHIERDTAGKTDSGQKAVSLDTWRKRAWKFLVVCIEKARKKLEDSIEGGAEYSYIYENSVELDRLIEIYIAMEY